MDQMPLPPYITHELKDKNRYQTVYAKYEGSAAAPTAGLHLMEEDAQMMLEAKGFKNAVVSLSDECCDVIVGKDDVTDEKRAQIEDIIKRKTNIGASNIVISTMD